MTRLEELREHLNANRKDGQTKLTYLPFLVKALVRALEEFPQCNARFDQEAGTVTEHQAVHVGIATHTDGGLMVPVLRDARSRDLWQIAAEIERLSDAARTGKASRADLTGSTITITSLGKLGGIVTTPVINHPEVAIIGVNKSPRATRGSERRSRRPADDELVGILRSPHRRRICGRAIGSATERLAGSAGGDICVRPGQCVWACDTVESGSLQVSEDAEREGFEPSMGY